MQILAKSTSVHRCCGLPYSKKSSHVLVFLDNLVTKANDSLPLLLLGVWITGTTHRDPFQINYSPVFSKVSNCYLRVVSDLTAQCMVCGPVAVAEFRSFLEMLHLRLQPQLPESEPVFLTSSSVESICQSCAYKILTSIGLRDAVTMY